MSDKGEKGDPITIIGVNKKIRELTEEIMVKQDVLERRMKSQSNAAVEQIAKSESRMTNRNEEMSSRMDKLEQMNNRMDRVESAILEMSRTLKAISNPNSDTKSEHTSGGPSTDQLESQLPQTFSTPASSFHKVQSTSPTIPRKPNGRIDFSNTNDRETISLTSGEKFVKEAWPQALLQKDVQDDQFTSIKNKVILRPELRLSKVDATTFTKLSEIQTAFRIALVPYWYWPQRLCLEMSEDFQGIRVWVEENSSVSWVMLLEAIFTMMQQLDLLHSPRTIFTRLAVNTGENIVSFASRLRSAFYQLSKNDRECDSVRDTFVDIVKTGMPQVWLHVQPQMKDKSTREGIELLVQIANRMMSWPSQINLCTNSATSFPTPQVNIANPLLNDTQVFPSNNTDIPLHPNLTTESALPIRDDTCHICKRKGHWAKDCLQKNHRYMQPHHNRQLQNDDRYDNLKKRFSNLTNKKRQPELSNKRYYKPNNNQKSYLVELNDKNTDELLYETCPNNNCEHHEQIDTDDELDKIFAEINDDNCE